MITGISTNNPAAYVAIKPAGLAHFLWFERDNIKIECCNFSGVDGWGAEGANTSIDCPLSSIEAVIYSDTLQF